MWIERFRFPDEPQQIDVFQPGVGYLGSVTGIGTPIGFLSGGRVVALIPDVISGAHRVGVFALDPPPW